MLENNAASVKLSITTKEQQGEGIKKPMINYMKDTESNKKSKPQTIPTSNKCHMITIESRYLNSETIVRVLLDLGAGYRLMMNYTFDIMYLNLNLSLVDKPDMQLSSCRILAFTSI
jgi:hypothetical protein